MTSASALAFAVLLPLLYATYQWMRTEPDGDDLETEEWSEEEWEEWEEWDDGEVEVEETEVVEEEWWEEED
jgi:hypothetical protein